MKKVLKVAGILLLVVIVAVATVFIWQKDNINAMISGSSEGSEEIGAQIDSEREEFKSQIEKYTSNTVTDISAEDEKRLLAGQISLEEIYEKYNYPVKENENNESSQNVSQQSDEKDSVSSVDNAVGVGIGKMYALKASYVSKIGELGKSAYSRYMALPENERTSNNKKKIVTDAVNSAAGLERDCDSEVETVLSELEEQLSELGSDSTEIIKMLKKAYNDEKTLKKSYYISLIQEHGM